MYKTILIEPPWIESGDEVDDIPVQVGMGL